MENNGSIDYPDMGQRKQFTVNEDQLEQMLGESLPTTNQFQELVMNWFSRSMFGLGQVNKDFDRVRQECGYQTNILPQQYRSLYDYDALAARVVQVIPKECWQKNPTIIEDDDPDVYTQFEKDWDELHQSLRSARGQSWFKPESGEGSPIWEYLLRADILSGIGHYGVILLGIDDGMPLDRALEPFRGIDSVPPGTEGLYGPQPFRGDAMGYDKYTTEQLQRQGIPSFAYPVPFNVRNAEEYQSVRDQLAANWKDQEKLTQFATNSSPVWIEDTNVWPSVIANSRQVNNVVAQDDLNIRGGLPSGYDTEESVGKGSKKRHKLIYLKVFDETIAQITRYERDPHNARFGLPQMYLLTFNDPRNDPSGGAGLPVASAHCHWSRLIHVVDNRGSNDVLGYPRMKQVFSHLWNAYKVYGAAGEGFWQQAFALLSVESNPSLGADFKIDVRGMAKQLQNVKERLTRHMIGAGVTVKSIAPSPQDPTAFINVFIEVICIFIGCPIRVFKGSERGELASSQDDEAWNERKQARNNFHTTPNIIVPFIDRLIACGVLAEPSKENGYKVVWPDPEALSKKDRAAVAQQMTMAMAQYVTSGLEAMMPPATYLTEVCGFSHESVQEFLAEAEKNADNDDQMTIQSPEDIAEQQRAMQGAAYDGMPGEDEETGQPEEETTENANPKGINQYTRLALGQFSEDEKKKGQNTLPKIRTETDEGYHTFKQHEIGNAEQIRMKDLGLIGMGRISGNHKSDDHSKYGVHMELDPSQVHYTQSSVIRSAVERKLHDFSSLEKTHAEAPQVTKINGEYHLQTGHHRAAAQIIATGKIYASVIEQTGKNPKKPRYKNPTENREEERADAPFQFDVVQKAAQDLLRHRPKRGKR